ncbi:hypothetical protein LVB87_14420 [Lysobacter sp. KIS68-7]|uniref:hypothetical protein n=1 Tax=Lysobacter sp. KIS68-7 TaxID=2904252 RepID=UPI001E3952CE|nr:hypothetical protein [Lysobacter sp. KIS68-7]UHQ19362.1 hypothetical protein LVB87_14420 [Lysobacter sp. KIS68-7]
MFRGMLLTIVTLTLVACAGESPGPLEGTWVVSEPFPVRVTFRSGEMEAMGVTKKLSYQIDGDQVLVMHKEGATKGITFTYTVVDAKTI